MNTGLVILLFLWTSLSFGQNIQLVEDMYPGDCQGAPCHSFPRNLVVFENKLHFIAADAPNGGGSRIWVKDGANPSEVLLNSPNEYVTEIDVFDTVLIAGGSDNGTDAIWVKTTTTDLTNMYNMPGGTALGDLDFTSYRNKIYFNAATVDPSDLWFYDPFAASNPIVNVSPTDTIGWPGAFTVFQDKLFFHAIRQGWRFFSYDDTNPPIIRTDLEVDPNYMLLSPINTFNNKLLVAAGEPNTGYELWDYSGTGTLNFVADLNPGNIGSSIGSISITYNNNFYFLANDGTHGLELFVYDGVNQPTMVMDINPGSNSSYIQEMIVFQNKLFFTADDGVHGKELWVYDGVNSPTIFEDFYPGSIGSTPSGYVIYNNDLFFSAGHPVYGSELFKIDQSVGLLENNLMEINVYPNPTVDGHIRIEFPIEIEGELRLIDLFGRVQETYEVKGVPTIDINNLSKGTYILEVVGKHSISTKKRIVISQ